MKIKSYIDNKSHQHLEHSRFNKDGVLIAEPSGSTTVVKRFPFITDWKVRVQIIEHTQLMSNKTQDPMRILEVALVMPSIDCANDNSEEFVCLFHEVFTPGIIGYPHQSIMEAYDYAYFLHEKASMFFKAINDYEYTDSRDSD